MQCKQQREEMCLMSKNKYIQEEILDIINDKMFKDHYNPSEVLKTNTPYILSYGGRNIGKTFAWLIVILALWQEKDYQSCIVRRMAEPLTSVKASTMFDKLFSLGIVPNKKEYDGIAYRQRKFCGYWIDDKGSKKYDEPFCFTYALSSSIEMNKGVLDIKNLGIMFFDEALTADNYLNDEFARFQNAVSSIVREQTYACCVLCANTVSWVAPYFREFCIPDVRKIKQGEIKIYQCLNETSVTVEYCNDTITKNRKKKLTDRRFFGFKSGTSKMITSGKWEISSYQHLTQDMLKERERELLSRDCYVVYADEICCLEIYNIDDFGLICNVRPCNDFDKGSRIYIDSDITDFRYRKYPQSDDKIDNLIWWNLYKKNKFYYADNLCGEVIKKYLQFCHMI